MTKKTIYLIILIGLILEFPIRYFVSPDPWIHNSDHWYFLQPLRLLIEMGFVFLALLPFFFIKELKDLMPIKWSKDNLIYLILVIIIPVAIFTFQQWEEIQKIFANNLLAHVPVWFVTGLFVGMGQELTFRALIFTGINKQLGQNWAIIISTLLFAFGSIHSPRMFQYFMNGYVFEAILLFVIFIGTGLLFVWLRIVTKNITIPAIAHGLGNGITWASFVIVKLYL